MRSGWACEFEATKATAGVVFERALSSLSDNERIRVKVSKPAETRTNAQNRLIWGTTYDQLMAGLAEEVGYDRHDKQGKDRLHEGLCLKYGGTVKDPVTGCEVRKFRTSKATKQEFSDYVEWVCRFAAEEYGVVVTLPGEL